MILIDTDVCIELLKGNRRVIEHRQTTDDTVALSFMSVGELYYGAEKSENPSKNLSLVTQLLLSVAVIQTNLSIMSKFGEFKAKIEREGQPLPDADVLIAATALEIGGNLITGNVRHFKRFDGLTIANWIR